MLVYIPQMQQFKEVWYKKVSIAGENRKAISSGTTTSQQHKKNPQEHTWKFFYPMKIRTANFLLIVEYAVLAWGLQGQGREKVRSP